MENIITTFKNQLTDRMTFKDQTGQIILSGQTCLFFNLNSLRARNYNTYKNIGNIAVFVRLPNKKESKLVFYSGKTKLRIITLHENDYKNLHSKKKNKKSSLDNIDNFYTLNCIVGDYSNMSDEWKKRVHYDEAINAAQHILNNMQ